jgi:methionyl-tRNA synthetase
MDFIEEVTEQLGDAKKQISFGRSICGWNLSKMRKCKEMYGDQCENAGSILNATDLLNRQ